MLAKIVPIGNSRGVRIPKPLLSESGLGEEVELKVKKGEIRILAISAEEVSEETLVLSEKVLSEDWDRPEEDKAWESLQEAV